MSKNNYLENLKVELVKRFGETDYFYICYNYSVRLYERDLPIIFDFLHICKLFNIDVDVLQKLIHYQDIFYSQLKLMKKSGGERLIYIPSYELKKIQRWILDNILYKTITSDYSYGFTIGKSILHNAKHHVNKSVILNMDIKDFFPSVNQDQVFKIYYELGYTKEVAFLLSKLCTYKNKLPQGAPTSPFISNIVCKRLDYRLSKLSREYNATYTRYADDLTFSSNMNIKVMVPIITEIVKEEGFDINNKKTRLLEKHQSQIVTGLVVNGDNVRVSKKYKNEVLKDLYYCKKFGVNDHLKKRGIKKGFYKEFIYGKAFFINMVEPEFAKRIFKLLDEIEWDY